MTQGSSDLTFDEIDRAPVPARMPLAVCWVIWIGAASALWILFLRAAVFLF